MRVFTLRSRARVRVFTLRSRARVCVFTLRSRARVRDFTLRSCACVHDFILRSCTCVCIFIVSDPRTAVSYQGHNMSNIGTSYGTVSESSPRLLIHCLPSACPLSRWHFTAPVVYLVGWRPKPWTLLKVAFPGHGCSQGG